AARARQRGRRPFRQGGRDDLLRRRGRQRVRRHWLGVGRQVATLEGLSALLVDRYLAQPTWRPGDEQIENVAMANLVAPRAAGFHACSGAGLRRSCGDERMAWS